MLLLRLICVATGLCDVAAVFLVPGQPVSIRMLIALGGCVFLTLGATYRPPKVREAEMLAIVHDRIARSEQLSVAAIHEVVHELAALRQRLDRGT